VSSEETREAGILRTSNKNHPEGVGLTDTMEVASLRKEDGTIVCERVSLAVNPYTRMKGLLGRGSLARDEGILLRPAGSIHMFFMRFAIDAVFLDRDLVVVDVVRGLRPWKVAARRGAKQVIELAEGAGADVSAGDHLSLARIEP
jgi:uncharacterized membrane protein (UPF0127 family)